MKEALAAHGLTALGDCAHDGGRLVLIGPDEPGFWAIFSASPEMLDGAPDPLNRWSVRVLTAVAGVLGAEPLFPFGDPPYHPFFTWAVQTGRFWPSPIGFLVHDERGLFASFRGALWFAGDEAGVNVSTRPCETCRQPCASACPVGAFRDGGYDAALCKDHVRSDAGRDCRSGGCLARRACPVGQGLRLPEQSAFHMEAFL